MGEYRIGEMMISVILSAGMGTRLMPLTKEIPKTLLEINSTTLLERMIRNCIREGISKFIVIVGYNMDKVVDLCPKIAEKYGVEIKTMANEDYEVTNTSVSTFIASRYIEKNPEDFILINGDNVVDPEIISRIVKCKNSAMIIDNYKQLNEESFKLIIDGEKYNEDRSISHGTINSIGKDLDIPSSTGEFIGVSKVISEDICEFNEILSGLIEENPQNYYDFAYEELSKIRTIDFVLTNGLKWTEIDDHDDWENAKILVGELEN